MAKWYFANLSSKFFFQMIVLIQIQTRSSSLNSFQRLISDFLLRFEFEACLQIFIWIQIQSFDSEYLFDFKFKSSPPNSYLKSNLKFRFRILIWIQSFIIETLVKFKVYFPSFYPNKNPERKLPIWLWIKSQRLSFEIE